MLLYQKILLFILGAIFLSCSDNGPVEVDGQNTGFYVKVVDSNNDPIPEVGLHYIYYFNSNIVSHNMVFSYNLHAADYITVKILNAFDNEITTLTDNEYRLPGKYTYNYDASNLTNGIYYCYITGSTISKVIKTFVLSDDIEQLKMLYPFKKTDLNGNIYIPDSAFGVGNRFEYPAGNNQIELTIADSLKIVLYKEGYKTFTQTIKLDLTNKYEATFQLIDSIAHEEILPINILQVKNVQWNLLYFDTFSERIYLNNYDPFYMVLRTNRILAYDNCNWMFGDYIINNDSLLTSNVGMTLLACSDNSFSFDHLRSKPKIMMRGDDLILIKGDTTFVYYSNYRDDILQYSFLNDTLTLVNSNDWNISFFDSLGLYPKLILDSEKEFYIRWYNKSPENTGFINAYAGIFGTNLSGGILFTILSSQYEGNYVSIYDLELVDRIVRANRFAYNGTTLSLINNSTNTYYDFR